MNFNMYFIVFFSLFCFSEGIQVTPEPVSSSPGFFSRYHNYHEMHGFLSELATNYSNFATLYSIGKSVQRRDLWVLKIKSPNAPLLGTPHIKYVGNIHGNEPVGRELILRFAEYILKNYETDNEVKWILDRAIVYLLPSLNPDGFERSKEGVCYSGPGRENANFVDLNRSFPDPFRDNKTPIQPETLAVATWLSEVPFLLSASFHGGALVANYPFDSNTEPGTRIVYERNFLLNLRNSPLSRTPPKNFDTFPDTIVNGSPTGKSNRNYVKSPKKVEENGDAKKDKEIDDNQEQFQMDM